MTAHIKLPNYKCSKCKFAFIPFHIGIRCPKCSFVDKDLPQYHGYVNQVLNSMHIHKLQYGNYHPGAWLSGSATEYIQKLCFQIFDALEKETPRDPIVFINKMLENFSDGPHRKHAKDIVLAVYEQYRKNKPPSVLQIIIKRIKMFLP